MTRINSNVSSMIARNQLASSNADLSVRLERLSTGLKINRGADNPAGLIVSERLRNEIAAVGQSVSNIERASNVIATTEAALQEINDLLVSMKALVVEAANTGAFSREEIAANQLQIDSAVESITRISNTTSFAGLKTLNGSLDYIVENLTTSQISDVSVYGANFGTNSSVPVSVEVLASAQKATLFLSGYTGTIPGDVVFTLGGTGGAQTLEFASGQDMSDLMAQINSRSDATGVAARLFDPLNSAAGIVLESTTYGSDAFISVDVRDDPASIFSPLMSAAGTQTLRDDGQDVLAIVNGNLALGRGTSVSLNTAFLSIELELDETVATTSLNTEYTFDITGGGAIYQIGPDVNSSQQVGFGIQSVAASNLGNSIVGFLTSITSQGDNAIVKGQARFADGVLDAAIDQVSTLRGRLGAFEKNTLDTTARSAQVALENLTASESRIRDADFAEETAKLSRAQILQQAGTQTLALANSSAESVLALLQ
ncbi:flagellin N-terminal helical domain-containing protein [Mucisphaera calidilacus]|uniref:Flagellin n=1 Tax=Mucisphaera calidilacus TaxID=2527982 RepID=A0A518BZG7_9BACT|nr:flagellin [Mucisphaera calidilacus]QDU72358.1 B-type flagellin [Mucisphaera calidilacus]